MTAESIRASGDARGVSCAMPTVKTAAHMDTVPSGALVEILATDPGSVKDFAAWARSTGNPLIEQSQDGGVFRFVIQRA
jgi:tRNA 2-thiouridine synthesizing protein A